MHRFEGLCKKIDIGACFDVGAVDSAVGVGVLRLALLVDREAGKFA